jgi:general secretion pathway protein I
LSRAESCDVSRGPALTAGFTLIEVLVAIAVVAVTIAAIGSVTMTATRGVQTLEQHLALVETMRTVASTLPARDQRVPGSLAGEIYGHRWRLDALPYTGGGIAPIPDSPWFPETLNIRVQSPSGAIIGVETMRLRPRPRPTR